MADSQMVSQVYLEMTPLSLAEQLRVAIDLLDSSPPPAAGQLPAPHRRGDRETRGDRLGGGDDDGPDAPHGARQAQGGQMNSRPTYFLSLMSEEEKLRLALRLLEDPVNQGNNETWEEYVNSAGPHGLSESDLDGLVDWLSFGTGTVIITA